MMLYFWSFGGGVSSGPEALFWIQISQYLFAIEFRAFAQDSLLVERQIIDNTKRGCIIETKA